MIIIKLDNDEVGRGATQKIMMIARRNYQCFDNHPVIFKDVNEKLVSIKIWINIQIDYHLYAC